MAQNLLDVVDLEEPEGVTKAEEDEEAHKLCDAAADIAWDDISGKYFGADKVSGRGRRKWTTTEGPTGERWVDIAGCDRMHQNYRLVAKEYRRMIASSRRHHSELWSHQLRRASGRRR